MLATPVGRELLDRLEPKHVDAVGLFDGQAVARLTAKLVGQDAVKVSEVDEMALMGALSTMLLHESFIASPSVAPAAVAGKVVERRPEASGPIRHAVVG